MDNLKYELNLTNKRWVFNLQVTSAAALRKQLNDDNCAVRWTVQVICLDWRITDDAKSLSAIAMKVLSSDYWCFSVLY